MSSGSYRYGFNGKENDGEVKGAGNQQDYGMRIYDPRLGRFLSVDPLTKGYPWYSPYHFAGNNPILFIDLDGEEPKKGEINYGKNVMVGRVNHKTLTNAFLNDFKNHTPFSRNNTNWISFPSSTSDLAGASSALTTFKENNPGVKIQNLVLSVHGGHDETLKQSVIFYTGDEIDGTKYISASKIALFIQQSSELSNEDKKAIQDLQTSLNALENGGKFVLKGCRADAELAMSIQSLAIDNKKIDVYFTSDKTETGNALDTRLIAEGETQLIKKTGDIPFYLRRVSNDYNQGFSQVGGETGEAQQLNKNLILNSQGPALQKVNPIKSKDDKQP